MLLDPHQRYFLHCELLLRSNRNKGEPLKLIEEGETISALDVLIKATKSGAAKIDLKGNDVVKITKVEHHPDRGMVVVLFRRGDPNASAQMFEHRKTGKLRLSDKTEDDLVAISSHLFIDTKQIGAQPRYRAILEEVPGHGRSYIQSLLDHVLRQELYTYKTPKDVEKETYTTAQLDGIKGEKLGAASGGSQFDYIELVRPAEPKGLDLASITPREEKMRLKVQVGAADLIGKLAAVKNWAFNQGWKEVRVRINMPEGRSRVVNMQRDLEASDTLFLRAVPVGVKKKLEACSDDVSAELVNLAAGQFGAWK